MSAHNILEEGLEAPQDLRRSFNGEAIVVDKSPAYCEIKTAGAETRTLARPSYVGQLLRLCANTLVGNCVVTVATGMNASGHTAITFSAAGHWIELSAMRVSGSLVWREIAKSGAATA